MNSLNIQVSTQQTHSAMMCHTWLEWPLQDEPLNSGQVMSFNNLEPVQHMP